MENRRKPIEWVSNGMVSELQRDSDGFERLATELRDLTGIHLPANPKNFSLMASRMNSLLRNHGLNSYSQLAAAMAGSKSMVDAFVCAMTTNTTEFFREPKHYEILKELLPGLLRAKRAAGSNELRIWCAAASTGQEPYSILVTVLQTLGEGACDIKFLATDIDREVLTDAGQAIYSENEVAKVPALYLQRYFRQIGTRAARKYQLRPEYRRQIRFAKFNLLSEPYPFQHPFDVIFCRNVLIYFEPATATEVVQRLTRALSPNGYLFLGHSESGAGRSPKLRSLATAVYQRETAMKLRKA